MAASPSRRVKLAPSYEAVNLTTLPTDVFAQVLGQVLPSDKAALRLVSRQLAATVRGQLTHASTARHISRRAAVSLQHSFPRLTSLALINPVSTHHLQLLSKLTCITFAPSKRSLGSLITVDLAPLEDLPRLHTLHLEQVQMQQLSTSPSCVMAALTQLQALRLVGCASSDKGAQDLAALPGVTKLQVVDKSPAGLARLNGLQNLHKIEVLELQNAVFCNCTRYLSSALATCTRLHTLVATGLWPLDLSVISQAPNLQCLAINICRGTSLSPLAKLPQLRYLDLGNSSFGTSALEELAELLLNMPQLQLCVVTLLRQPSENVVETTLLQTSLDKALTRQIPVCEKIAYGYRKQAHAAAEEWWLCSNDTGALLRAHGLMGQDIWDSLRRAEPQTSDCRLLAFLKLVAAGLGYQNVSADLEGNNLGGVWQRQHALPGQQLNCRLDSPVELGGALDEEEEQ